MKDFFNLDDLQACRDAISELVEELAQKLYERGKIQRKIFFNIINILPREYVQYIRTFCISVTFTIIFSKQTFIMLYKQRNGTKI